MFLFSLQNAFEKYLVSVHKVCERRTCRAGAPSAWFAVPEVAGRGEPSALPTHPLVGVAFRARLCSSAALNRKW